MSLSPDSTVADSNAKQIRLLICGQCKTVEELPDFEGPVERDETLAFMVSKHKTAGIPHAPAQLAKVAAVTWDSPEARRQIQEKIAQSMNPNATTGFGTETYALMNTLRDDAMTCFGQHQRNPNCSDYKSDSKRLAPGTSKERKELGLDPVYDRTDRTLTRYLCEHCPVHSMVVQAARKQAGMYDK